MSEAEIRKLLLERLKDVVPDMTIHDMYVMLSTASYPRPNKKTREVLDIVREHLGYVA